MFIIYTLNRNRGISRYSAEDQYHLPGCALLTGVHNIPCGNRQLPIWCSGDNHIFGRVRQPLIAKLVQKREGIEARLIDSTLGAQAKLSVKGNANRAIFFKYIRKRPE